MTDRRPGEFSAAAIAVIESLRPGEVMAYGEVAEEAGFPAAGRAVGNLLAATPGLPWWRIVTRDGRLAPGHEQRQAELLRAEGVIVRDGRVDLESVP